MLNARSIQGILILSIGAFVALWLGISIVTSQFQTLLYVAGTALLLTCVFLGRKIWLLLIFFSALNVPLIRGFGTEDLGQVLFLGFTLVMFLLRRQQFSIRFGELEVLMLLIAACIIQVYVRNPVGIAMFGADDVGGRPYYIATLAFSAGIVLGNIVVKPADIRWAMKLKILGAFMGLGLTALRMSGALPAEAVVERKRAFDSGQGSDRVGPLAQIGSMLALIVCSYRSPLRSLLHPLWAFLIAISLVAAAASGYRNIVAWVGLIYLVAIAYRGGWPSLIGSTLAGALALALLAFINLQAPLPPNIQRALSPFPGTWEERHVNQAEASTQWRVEMWKEALLTDYWIHDKLLGDGLGFSKRELELLQEVQSGAGGRTHTGSDLSFQQEGFMISGGYHSGPVQTIRAIGYLGLLVLLLAMIRVAVHAHRQILRCSGTEWQPIAFFFGIPMIAHPIFWVFIFGDFAVGVATTFISYGMVRLLEKNLPLPAYVVKHRRDHVPLAVRNRAGEPQSSRNV